MARPRTPAKILELRGAFKANPQRRRKDAEGAGPFQMDPPTHLAAEAVPAWRYLVERLPRVTLSSSDEVAVEAAAVTLAGLWQLSKMLGALAPLSPSYKSLSAELRLWLQQLGMTPQARTKIPAAPEGEKTRTLLGNL
jgi:phage terminase small subunit